LGDFWAFALPLLLATAPAASQVQKTAAAGRRQRKSAPLLPLLAFCLLLVVVKSKGTVKSKGRQKAAGSRQQLGLAQQHPAPCSQQPAAAEGKSNAKAKDID
jgi:hypothetical protein